MIAIWGCLLAMTLSGWALAAAEPLPHANWVNALAPKGVAGPKLTLATAEKAEYTILIPARANLQERAAAGELARWLKAITMAPFAVAEENAATRVSRVMSLGATRLLERSLPDLVKHDLGEEGYAIATQGDNLFLVGGRRRGPVYAVFALLEEDLGCRWYTNDVQVIPHQPTLSFQPVARSFTPPLSERLMMLWNAQFPQWSLRNRTTGVAVGDNYGGTIQYAPGWFVHTFSSIIPRELSANHPDYFPLRDGKRVLPVEGGNPSQLCLTHPEVLKLSIAKVREVLKQNPKCNLISVSQNDGNGDFCQCKTCKPIEDEEGAVSGPLVRFVNQIAEAIEKDYPKVKISTLAYGSTFLPPRKTKPRSNVLITLCTDSHNWQYPCLSLKESISAKDKFYTALQGWSAMGADICIWDYVVHFHAYPWIVPNMEVVAENLRTYAENRVAGVMLQSDYQGPGSDDAPLRAWVWAKQLWDSRRDTQALIKDYVYGYFGAAAEPMWKYQQLRWKLGRKIRKDPKLRDGWSFLDRAFVDEALACFRDAEGLAKEGELARRIRQAKMTPLFARLELGPKDISDCEAYQKALAEFVAIAKENSVRYLSEDNAEASFDAKLMKWRAWPGRCRLKDVAPGTIVLDVTNLSIANFLGKMNPVIVEDSLAEIGFAARQPGGSRDWSIGADIPIEQLEPGRRYLLRARVRLEKTNDAGGALSVGVYNTQTKDYHAVATFTARQAPGGKYAWLDMGAFVPRPNDRIFANADNNLANVKAVYYERFELVPCKKEKKDNPAK
jgi:hypothetical protein